MPKKKSVKDFINNLGPTSGIRISDAKPPSDLDGEQKKWHNNGNTKGTWYYKNDVLHGILTEWYSNGNLKHKKKYDNGTLIELLENYDINGSKLY